MGNNARNMWKIQISTRSHEHLLAFFKQPQLRLHREEPVLGSSYLTGMFSTPSLYCVTLVSTPPASLPSPFHSLSARSPVSREELSSSTMHSVPSSDLFKSDVS